jgi:Xaa-Pro aminopeptidase
MQEIHRKRIKKALSLLRSAPTSQTLVISSNPAATRSRDTHFPYRQNSDLFYLTGTSHQSLTLVLRPHAKEQIVLVAPPEDPLKKVWDGSQPSPKALARSLGASEVLSKDVHTAVRNLVRGSEVAFLQSIPGTVSADLRKEFATRSPHSMRGLPASVVEAERLTSRLRCVKDATEINLIRKAADLTSAALLHAAQFIRPGMKERELAVLIEYLYRLHNAEPAFNTIVATGPSAATLHYHQLGRTLRKGELLLIDTGCELGMYACDVSRTIPVSSDTPAALVAVYDCVLRAQEAAIRAVNPGVSMSEVHAVAARELTYGLKELGVLRGNPRDLLKKGAYKPYFPHGIGHSLGIDVHDVGPGANDSLGVLEKGMVVTIEPGLYFSKPAGKIPACGVRIEDDVLVTARGCDVLTAGVFPKRFDEMRNIVE